MKLIGSIAIWIFCVMGIQTKAQPAQDSPRFNFAGKLLVVACDADMLPSAYIDGKLGPEVGSDVVSIIRLDRNVSSPNQLRVATVPVPNSVTGPPSAVAATPDGRYAIVAETQGSRPAGKPDATLNDLLPGRKLTVIDLQNPEKPTVVQQIDSYERPVSVAVNSTGDKVAVAFAAKSHSAVPLVLFPFVGGRLGKGVEPALPTYGQQDGLTDAEFLPGEARGAEILAVTFGSSGYGATQHARLGLFMIEPQGELRAWGNMLDLDPSPFLVRFTPDGRFALVNSMHNFANGRGTVTSIQLAATKDQAGQPVHAIASRAETGQQPEGLAVSPDGRWVATANLETSYLPLKDRGQKFYSSVSLLRIDKQTGILERVHEFAFDGMLPEPIVFDDSSRFLALGNFSQFDDPKAGGAIEFFRIEDSNPQPGRIELVHLKDSVAIPRGPESMAIVR